MKIIEHSVSDLAQLISEKKVSVTESVKAYLDQIEKMNPKINAVVDYRPELALLEAQKLDFSFKKQKRLGALYGIPFTVKDIFDVENYKTTAGCVTLKDNIAKTDATLVKRLKKAGAICIGKTNTPEFENSADTFNDLFGKTKNPHDLTRSAGGSSGGSAAAVAAFCSAFDIGADHGGSLRIPAHCNGITTIRSTVGRIPSTGVLYGLRTGLGACFNSEGPLARSVADLKLILKIIQGPDKIDPNTLDYPWKLSRTFDRKKISCAFYFENSNVTISEDVKNAIKTAANVFTEQGITMVCDVPHRLQEGFEIYQNLCGNLAINGFKALFKSFNVNSPSDMILQQMRNFEPYLCDLPTYLQRWSDWDLFRKDIYSFFDKYDALIYPVCATEALPLETPMWYGKVNFLSPCWETSAARLPAVVVRSGTSKSGLPIGVQILTKPFNEELALFLAQIIETELQGSFKNTARILLRQSM